MVQRRTVSKFASPIDKRPTLNASERDACSELPLWERAFLAIQERMRAKGMEMKPGSAAYLKRKYGGRDEPEEAHLPEANKKNISKYKQVDPFPQVAQGQHYRDPRKRK